MHGGYAQGKEWMKKKGWCCMYRVSVCVCECVDESECVCE